MPEFEMPSFVQQMITLFLRHGLTTIAGFLVANGMLSVENQEHFISIVIGVVLGLVALIWSVYQKLVAKKTLVAAVQAPKSVPVSK